MIKKSTLYTHLPSFGHSLCFFAVDVSLYAGLSSGDENCVPKSQSSQSHSYCAKRTKHTWLNPLPIWQKQSAPSILTHTTDCRLYTTLGFELFNNKTAHFAIKGSYKTHLWHRLWLPLPVKKEAHCLYKIEPFLPRTTQSPTAHPWLLKQMKYPGCQTGYKRYVERTVISPDVETTDQRPQRLHCSLCHSS